jgi:hypothetical protein
MCQFTKPRCALVAIMVEDRIHRLDLVFGETGTVPARLSFNDKLAPVGLIKGRDDGAVRPSLDAVIKQRALSQTSDHACE